MDEQNFGKLISTLWSFAMWGNKSYLLSKILKDNPLEELKPKLRELLYGDRPLEKRFDHFRQETIHFGPATISELLSFVHPDDTTALMCAQIMDAKFEKEALFWGTPIFLFTTSKQAFVELPTTPI